MHKTEYENTVSYGYKAAVMHTAYNSSITTVEGSLKIRIFVYDCVINQYIQK